jgi:hypothetical protein
VDIQLYQHEWNWENETLYGNTTPEGRSVFIQFRVFPTSTSVDITIYQYGKNGLYFFYNIAMSKAWRIRKISLFTSGGKFPVLTLSYINTALSQSAFRIYKCYIINKDIYWFIIATQQTKQNNHRQYKNIGSQILFTILILK